MNKALKLPQVIGAFDYHEFCVIKSTLCQFGVNVKFEEVSDLKTRVPGKAFSYWAIFYQTKQELLDAKNKLQIDV